MVVKTFLELTDDQVLQVDKKLSYTTSGQALYPIGVPIPIIVIGKRCIGIAVVSKMIHTQEGTTIEFTVSSTKPEYAQAYYALYRNQVTMRTMSSEDPYENTDMVIPGLAGGMTPPTPQKRKKRSSLLDNIDKYYL